MPSSLQAAEEIVASFEVNRDADTKVVNGAGVHAGLPGGRLRANLRTGTSKMDGVTLN